MTGYRIMRPIDETDECYATRLKELRQSAGVGVRELARRADVSGSAIVRFEAGDGRPAAGTAVRIVRSLDYSETVTLELVARVMANRYDLDSEWASWLPAADAVVQEVQL